MALEKLQVGEKITGAALEKIKGLKEGESIVIAPLSNEVQAAKIHYDEEIGYFYCNSTTKDIAVCCDKKGMPKVKYALPVIAYGGQRGSMIFDPESPDWDLKPLLLNKVPYDNIILKKTLKGDLTKLDLLLTCTDATYQTYTFEVLGEARWRTSNLFRANNGAELKNSLAIYNRFLETVIASTYTNEEISVKLGGGIPSTYVPPAAGAQPSYSQVPATAPQQVTQAAQAPAVPASEQMVQVPKQDATIVGEDFDDLFNQ